MEKDEFEMEFINTLNRTFSEQSEYFNYEFRVFFPLRPLMFQANKCLMLDFYFAAVTLTNYVLERLLKLALIYEQVGIRPIPMEQWDSIFGETDKRYGSINLATSIDLCKKKNLITEGERNFLNNTIREMVRNGFSHADSNKILSGLPDKTRFLRGSFKDLKFEEIILNPKVNPSLQSVQIENFAKANSHQYFDFVFHLMTRIEERIINFDKAKSQ